MSFKLSTDNELYMFTKPSSGSAVEFVFSKMLKNGTDLDSILDFNFTLASPQAITTSALAKNTTLLAGGDLTATASTSIPLV